MSKVLVGMAALISACLICACDAGTGTGTGGGGDNSTNPGWSSDPRNATDPDGVNTPLKNLPSDSQVDDALKAAGDAIDQFRSQGVNDMIDSLKQDLAAAGVSTSPLDGVGDASTGSIKTPNNTKPGGVDANGNPLTGLDSQGKPIPGDAPNYGDYFSCPILAPEPSQDDDCGKLVGPTVLKVQAEVEQQMASVEDTINAQNPSMSSEGRSFVSAWAQTALRYGADVAATYATQELRAAGACDTKLQAMQVAHLVGHEQGQSIVISHYDWARAQVAANCRINTDVVASAVKTMSLNEVTSFMSEHMVCVNVDVSTGNQVLITAEEKRQDGIQEGIGVQVEVLRGLLLLWSATLCRPTGDPLVLDLEGNGVGFSAAPVSFDLLGDGHPQQVSWVGPRTAMLALDLDGNGKIETGAELFGDRNSLDGISALAAYDRPERGGNGDGLIDSHDAVFAQLQLWTDANQDGISQPDELRTLADAGVLTLSLEASRRLERNAAGMSSAELQVLTTQGFRSGYDLWLNMGLTLSNLAALKP